MFAPGERSGDEDARLRLIEAAPDGIFVTRDGVILYVNPAGARMLGANGVADVINKRLAEILSPRELEAGSARLASLESHRALPTRIYDVIGLGGKALTVEATSIAIEWNGAPAGLTFGRDITERVRLESALARADRLTALGLLAAGVAHEINNPLTFVSLGLDELTQLANQVPEPIRTRMLSLVGDLRSGLDRVTGITADLRTFARDRDDTTSGQSDIGMVLATVQRLVCHRLKHSADLTIELPAKLASVRVAAQRLEQVFVNLLVNASEAFDAAGRKGTIAIRFVGDDGKRVSIEVADDGVGIASKPTGLGSQIVTTLVENELGGSLEWRAVGGGSEVEVRVTVEPMR